MNPTHKQGIIPQCENCRDRRNAPDINENIEAGHQTQNSEEEV